MDINDFNYDLPEELIAQEPSKIRYESRLLVINKRKQTYQDKIFKDIVDYFHEGDVLVRNNTKVLPVRLYGIKEGANAHVELLLLKDLGNDIHEALTGNAKAVKKGSIIHFGNDILKAECIEVKEEGIRLYKFFYQGIFLERLEEVGKMPLPPYIHKQLLDNERYQTVYAKVVGSSAAPTAGFHFTDDLFEQLKVKGVEILDITLHIGLGTFRPVKTSLVEEHHMHSEYYEISPMVASRLNLAKKENRRIIALGTTSTRTLEANFTKYGQFKDSKEETDIFIYPGYHYQAIDALITNFHLPKSTLIMLVSAFMGREFTLEVYRHAVKEKYRFFSFGDAMFIYDGED